MTQIKTFEDACKALNRDAEKLPDVSLLPEKHGKSVVAFYKLATISEAINDGWEPDWSDYEQYKYYPWFTVKASKNMTAGSGLSCSDWFYAGTDANVGSRLCFKTAELAEYAGKQFIKLYEDYLLIA